MGKVQTASVPDDDFEDIEADAEQKEAAERAESERQARLDAFAAALTSKRKRAVEARQMSGIEEQWRGDEEFYEGVDDANRHEVETKKPVNQTGGASVNSPEPATGSNIFLNITRPYVDFSAGRAADMLLPTEAKNWGLGPTPMPHIVAEQENPTILDPTTGMTVGKAAKMMIAEIAQKAEAAEKRIEDWHEEGQYNAEQRKLLKDGAKVGVAILKGPIPVKRTARAVIKDPKTGTYQMKILKETKPVSRRIDYWKFFPDPACGENIHNGSYVWECDDITARQIRDLKGTLQPGDREGDEAKPMYIESAIDLILQEGPQKRYEGDRNYQAPDSEIYQIWYYNGVAEAADLRAAGIEAKEGDVLPVLVTMINDRVIKVALTTLDSGEFPYDVFVWQPIAGFWAGIGVGRQVREPQRILNAGVRNMMDNAGLAAGPQIVYKDGTIVPVDKIIGLKPRKFWKMNKDTEIDDVRKAFAAITIPMMQEELMAIIQFALKMAEDITGLPMLMQGQQGTASDTVGGMQILTNNSNTPMRTIAKLFDDMITTPHLNRYYEWLLQYGPDDNEKGDFQITARGSSALFERDAQHQAILAMAPLVKDPAYGIDPKKWIKEALKAQRLLPEVFQYTEEEMKQMEEAMKANPPTDPKLEAAKIGAQARIETAKIAAEVQKERIAKDTDRDTVYVQAEMQRAQAAVAAADKKLQQELQITLAKFAEERNLSLEAAKVELSKIAMQLNTQKELAGLDAHGPQVANPPTEPPGRADDGQAYQE